MFYAADSIGGGTVTVCYRHKHRYNSRRLTMVSGGECWVCERFDRMLDELLVKIGG